MSIEVQQLTKTYGTQVAVNHISFSIPGPQVVGFLGPNGAGKSTTMKMMTGYLTPDSGTARIAGVDVLTRPLEVKKRIGYLPESNPLYYDMYVKEYLGFIADVHGLGRAAATRINHVIGITGLTPEYKKTIGALSKGYKQRVGLAAALLHDPEVLILDEPTSGLDPNQIVDIRELIRGLGREKTVLFSSHILQEVEALCDRVIIIHQGNLVADSSLDELRAGASGRHEVTFVIRESIGPDIFAGERLIESFREKEKGHWILTTVSPDELKKRLLGVALRNSWNIVSLHSETSSLETIFRTLTKAEDVTTT